MTIDKTKSIIIPQWIFSALVSVLTTAFITWGILTATKASLELRTTNTEKRLDKIELEKVNKVELQLMLENISIQLNDIKTGVGELKGELENHVKTQSSVRSSSPTSMLQRNNLNIN